MTTTVKSLLLLAAVLQQPGCVASRAPHEPYRPPIIEPLLFQPEPGATYLVGVDVCLWEDRKASQAGPREEICRRLGVISPQFAHAKFGPHMARNYSELLCRIDCLGEPYFGTGRTPVQKRLAASQ